MKQFHPSDKIYEQVIDKYYFFIPRGSDADFAGVLVRINEGWGVLNPSVVVRYNKNNLPTKQIEEENTFIRLEDILGIIPISKQDLERFCERFNKNVKLRSIDEKSKKTKRKIIK